MPSVAQRERAETKRRPLAPRNVYLDYHASTPCDPRVVEAMLPYFLDTYANPASSVHRAGRKASDAVETAREQVARAIGAEPGEIVFTSGATESNNLAILGSGAGSSCGRTNVLASAIEHKSVLAPCRSLTNRGFNFDVIPVDRDGLLDLGALVELVDDSTFLVSVQAVNNEIGTIQPILEVVQIAHAAGALVHCDAAQALGRIPIDVGDWGVDLLSLSGHKCYGPKGVGALYVRGAARNAPMEPLVHGGGQEYELRAGTLNVPGIVGLGLAAEIAAAEREAETKRVAMLRDWLEAWVLEAVPDAHRNGSLGRRVAGNSSITFPGMDAEALIANLRDVHLSTGSACTSGAPTPSHVLLAIGLTRAHSYCTIRIGLGRFTAPEEINYAARHLTSTAVQSRDRIGSLAPLPPTLARPSIRDGIPTPSRTSGAPRTPTPSRL